jgi:hypothetical protein
MVGKVNKMHLQVDGRTRFLVMYTPQQITGFERALEKARTERDRYQKKIDQCNETISGFEALLKECKREIK